ELEWRTICFEILDQLLDSLNSSENDSGIANWRIILGTSEACYLIRHLDPCDYKGEDILRMEYCWTKYYGHLNCHVRALIAEGFFGIVGEMEFGRSGWDTGRALRYLQNYTEAIKRWLLDDEIWVLEHVYQAFRIVVEKQTDDMALRSWAEKCFSHVEANPTCLLAHVSKQTGKSWAELERGDFLRQIQAIQRSQLSQQRISH
ncbi:MAG: hypothetical protein H0X02_09145, partial [Nitrosomonas sp.]|nr:hypothetical protein [Nitrosomonas sp.]